MLYIFTLNYYSKIMAEGTGLEPATRLLGAPVFKTGGLPLAYTFHYWYARLGSNQRYEDCARFIFLVSALT